MPIPRALPTLLLALLMTACTADDPAVPRPGRWSAWLESPGGPLVFGLDLERGDDGWAAWLVNGEERLPVPRVELSGDRLVLGMDHYDSEISATLTADGARLDGEWIKRRGPDAWTRLPFGAEPGDPFACPSDHGTPLREQRYRVTFASDEVPAQGVFELDNDGCARGTFLTTTGDYRFLAGTVERRAADDPRGRRQVTLSCFDGAHAFLFRHDVRPDGSLVGDFWSRESWHDTYTAVEDEAFALPDGFALTRAEPTPDLGALAFPDLEGTPRRLDDPAFAGKARILQVFGSWCPNCHDASELMAELDRTYRERGLSIVGLAFELTGDHARDAEQVRRYAERHGVTYPLLIAGLSGKDDASAALPLLDRVRSYPTTIFLDGQGGVRAVYQGFSGPATGQAHRDLRAAFTGLVEELLGEG